MNVLSTQQVLAAALRVYSLRADVLAQNVANADTPGFIQRDVDFTASLNRALAQGAVTSVGVERNLVLKNRRADGNDIDLSQQLGKYYANELAHMATLRLYSDVIGRLKTAAASS